MTIQKIACALTSVAVTGVVASAFAGAGVDGKFNLNEPVNVFTEAAKDGLTTAKWTNKPTVEGTGESAYMVIESDSSAPSTYDNKTATTEKIVTCTFNMKVSSVPTTALLTPVDAQTAFCVSDGKYKAYVNNGEENAWVALAGAPGAEDSAYTLTVTFDYKTAGGPYVQFKIGSDAASAWFKTASAGTGISTYSFVGDGEVKSFAANQASIASETETIGDKVLKIPEADAAAIATAAGSTPVATYLAQDAKTTFAKLKITAETMNVAEAYGLGLVAKNGETLAVAAEEVVATTPATRSATPEPTKIPLALNVQPPADAANVSFQLIGYDGEAWKNVGSSTTDAAQLAIPVDGKVYKQYKVKANVTLKTVN